MHITWNRFCEGQGVNQEAVSHRQLCLGKPVPGRRNVLGDNLDDGYKSGTAPGNKADEIEPENSEHWDVLALGWVTIQGSSQM